MEEEEHVITMKSENPCLSSLSDEDFKKVMEHALNSTYPGLTVFVRDVNLSDKCIEKYETGQIIMELGYAEGSVAGKGGVPTSCRYVILSSHLHSLDEMIERGLNSNFGPVGCGIYIAPRGAHFKVLDVYHFGGKTLITLLHLPDDDSWKIFINMNNPEDDERLTQTVREMFEERCNLEPLKAISSPDVLERWAYPLGMSDDGELVDIFKEEHVITMKSENPFLSGLSEEDFKEVMEHALNSTYQDLVVFIRDVNLPDKCIEKYETGQIIMELGYAEGSVAWNGGVPTSCRYVILSSHLHFLDEMIERGLNSNFGPVGCGIYIAPRGAHFKVLDVYHFGGKTLITLLHLPDDDSWKFFINMDNPEEDERLTQTVREIFEECCNHEPLKTISSPDVLERWVYPLGMSDDGELFDIFEEVPDYSEKEST